MVSKTSFRDSDGNIIKFEHCDALHSTTELAREYARSGYPDRYVIFTEKQGSSAITKTKLSDGSYEDGMFISCILRPSIFPSQAGLLGPLAAVALVTALEEHTTKKLGIGWVSDIYCDGVRIGGAAIEGKLDSHSTYEYLIVSFAIKMRDADFPPRLTDMIRKVFESENASIPMIIAKTVLTKFFSVYSGLKNPGKHINTYRNKFVLIGKKIKFIGLPLGSACGFSKKSIDMSGGIQIDDRVDCLEDTNAELKILVTWGRMLPWNHYKGGVDNFYIVKDMGEVAQVCEFAAQNHKLYELEKK